MLDIKKIRLVLSCIILPVLVFLLVRCDSKISYSELIVFKPVTTISQSTVNILTEIKIINPIKLPEVAKSAESVPVPSIVDNKHIKCMADNIYHESAGEPYMGQVAVARVVINRVKHKFASDPCSVIYQSIKKVKLDKEVVHCQFSWVCQGKKTPPHNSLYEQAIEIATQVITEDKWKDEFNDNVLFFHSTRIPTQWTYNKAFTIGNHVFYSYDKK